MEPLNNSILSDFPSWLGRTTLQATVLVCLILLVQFFFRRRLPGRWRHALWLLLVIRLILPWAPSSPVSVFNLVPRESTRLVSYFEAIPTGFMKYASFYEGQPDMNREASQATAAEGKQHEPGTLKTELVFSRLDWRDLLKGIWLLGVVLIVLRSVQASLRLWWIIRQQRPVTDSTLLNLLEDCKECMGVKTLVGLVESDRLQSPALFGFVRPRLLVPTGMLQELSHEQLRYIFLHELAHLKRLDVLLGWITLLLQAIHWFNPLVWIGFHRMRTDREMACDQLVLRHVSPEETVSYGKTILFLLQHFTRRQYLPSVAGILEQKTQAERRILMITHYKEETRADFTRASLIVCLMGTLVLTNAVKSHAQPAEGQADESYQIIVQAATTDGQGSASGYIDFAVSDNGIRWQGEGSYTRNTPGIPLGTISMYHLRNPSLFLRLPLQSGATWSDQWTGYVATSTLLKEKDPISSDVGSFSGCLLLKTEIHESIPPDPDHDPSVIESVCGTRYIWLAKGVGIISMVYEHRDGTTTAMLLTDYEIPEDTQAYFPTVHHARWSYFFKNDAFTEGVNEHWTLNDLQKVEHRSFESLKPTDWDRNNAKPSSKSIREVILTDNGRNGRYKAFAEAESESGRRLSVGQYSLYLRDSAVRSVYHGSQGYCPEPIPTYLLWTYLCHKEQTLFTVPVTLGETYSQNYSYGSLAETVLEDFEAVAVEAGQFTHCLRHVTVISGASESSAHGNAFNDGIRTLWFAPGVGLVKMHFEHDNGVVTEGQLVDYEVDQGGSDYLPLALGNQWTYRWQNNYRDEPTLETIRLTRPGDRVYMFVPDGAVQGPDWRAPEFDPNMPTGR